jgi:hypothetical protein
MQLLIFVVLVPTKFSTCRGALDTGLEAMELYPDHKYINGGRVLG